MKDKKKENELLEEITDIINLMNMEPELPKEIADEIIEAPHCYNEYIKETKKKMGIEDDKE